ncbi:hypothetical protein B4U80_12556, partial [Leptotrombidium deliense]
MSKKFNGVALGTEIAVDTIFDKFDVDVELWCEDFENVNYLRDINFCVNELLEVINCNRKKHFCADRVVLWTDIEVKGMILTETPEFEKQHPFWTSMLSISWGPGYSAWNPWYSMKRKWSIHGLWPRMNKDTEEDYIYTRKLTRDEYNDLDSETKKDISAHWGDFEYLSRQWAKHGIFYTEHPDIRSGTRWLQKTIQLF